jgi:hypothetical protein
MQRLGAQQHAAATAAACCAEAEAAGCYHPFTAQACSLAAAKSCPEFISWLLAHSSSGYQAGCDELWQADTACEDCGVARGAFESSMGDCLPESVRMRVSLCNILKKSLKTEKAT